jgi:hypothetical protein
MLRTHLLDAQWHYVKHMLIARFESSRNGQQRVIKKSTVWNEKNVRLLFIKHFITMSQRGILNVPLLVGFLYLKNIQILNNGRLFLFKKETYPFLLFVPNETIFYNEHNTSWRGRVKLRHLFEQ